MTETATPPRHLMLPKGWVAEVVTYLEMTAPAPMRVEPAPAGLVVAPVRPDCAAYRERFRRVGEAWLWGSRLKLDDAALGAIIGDPAVEIFDLTIGADIVGLLELDFRTAGACEIAFFGVVEQAIGIGAGRFLMNRTIERAWTRKPAIARLWVHTCTHDHPEALGFYMRSGFRPYARGIECFPDPRLDGTLPREAAPQFPLI